MAEKKVFSTVTKMLLKNVIRHTDSHNKVVEESEMWRQREKETRRRRRGDSDRDSDRHPDRFSNNNSFLKDRRSDMRYEFSSHRQRRAHMDDEPKSTGTYWMKQLYKAEEADNNRWGHSGFKELYPERFSSSDSSDSEEESRRRERKRHHRKTGKRKYSETDTDSDSEEKTRKHRKKHKHKKKSKKKKHKKRRHKKEYSSDTSSS